MKAGTSLTIHRMCELGRVSREGWYQFGSVSDAPQGHVEVRGQIQKIALEWPAYGSPRRV